MLPINKISFKTFVDLVNFLSKFKYAVDFFSAAQNSAVFLWGTDRDVIRSGLTGDSRRRRASSLLSFSVRHLPTAAHHITPMPRKKKTSLKINWTPINVGG